MEYESLAGLIEPYIDGPCDKLPDGLRARMGKSFSVTWDGLTSEERSSLALQHDFQNDPAMKHENRYWRDLESEIWATKLKIAEWEKKDRRIPSEALIWAVKQAALGDRLSKLEGLRELAPFLVKDWKALTDDALAKVVADAPVSEQSTGTPAPVGDAPTKSTKRTWVDVTWSYLVDTFKAGQYATAQDFYSALEKKAGIDGSPFDKGTGDNRGSLFVRELSETVSLKTIQNRWGEIKKQH